MRDPDSSGRYDLLMGVISAVAILLIFSGIVVGVINLFNGLAC